MAKTALVLGAGGFIGSHMVKRLKSEGYWVRGVDLKEPEFSPTQADNFFKGDLTDKCVATDAFILRGGFDEVYQFAADMGGAGYIFSGENDANIFTNSMQVNINCAEAAVTFGVKKLFFSSSACIYPAFLQDKNNAPAVSQVGLKESDAIPADPDSIYGWEKLIAEQMYEAFKRNYGLNIRIGRFHNIFGPEGTYQGGREKAPAAICRKVAEARDGDSIQIWGDGEQTRSFLYIDECIEAVRRMMQINLWVDAPILNIGSDEIVSINHMADIVIDISGKKNITLAHDLTTKTLGVRGRNSDNTLIEKVLNWKPTRPLHWGLRDTYKWIYEQITPYVCTKTGTYFKEELTKAIKNKDNDKNQNY
jgi:GDP-D-mannose 3',5'-epimerase